MFSHFSTVAALFHVDCKDDYDAEVTRRHHEVRVMAIHLNDCLMLVQNMIANPLYKPDLHYPVMLTLTRHSK